MRLAPHSLNTGRVKGTPGSPPPGEGKNPRRLPLSYRGSRLKRWEAATMRRRHTKPPRVSRRCLLTFAVSSAAGIGVVMAASIYQGEPFAAVSSGLFLLLASALLPIAAERFRAVEANRVALLVIGEHLEHADEAGRDCLTAVNLALRGQTDPKRLGLRPGGSVAFALGTGAHRWR